MKDTLFTARRKKRELLWLAGAFLLANAINIYAIVEYHSPASELLTSLFYVLTATVVIYLLTLLVRGCVGLIAGAIRVIVRKR